MNHDTLISKAGTLVTVFFLSITMADIELIAKIVAAVLAIGAGGSTWYFNHLKIRHHKKEVKDGFTYKKK